VLNLEILNDRDRIREGLKQPYLVLPNAFLPEVAETLYTELQATQAWSAEKFENELYEFERDRISFDAADAPPSLTRMYEYLRSSEMLGWFSTVSNRSSDDFVGFAGYYRDGHQLTKHNDMLTYAGKDGGLRARTVAFTYYLTRNWQASWGGRLIWEKPYAEILPEFNTLVLFVVGPASMHWVEPVDRNLPEKRLSLSGWYTNTLVRDARAVKKLKLSLG